MASAFHLKQTFRCQTGWHNADACFVHLALTSSCIVQQESRAWSNMQLLTVMSPHNCFRSYFILWKCKFA